MFGSKSEVAGIISSGPSYAQMLVENTLGIPQYSTGVQQVKYIHYEFDTGENDIIEISLNKQANVRLLDASNYNAYKNGRAHSGVGGLAKKSPVRFSPGRGHWHVVVDLGGYSGSVNASARLIS